MQRQNLLRELGKIYLAEFDLEARGKADRALKPSQIDKLGSAAAALAAEASLAYTAFDGDHQQLVPLMRRSLIRKGKVPANPDSILDYKEAVQARQTKEGVLLDDLAILRSCSELIIFTEASPDLKSVESLAEGVLVELAFFLKRRGPKNVYFASISALLSTGEAELTSWAYEYEDLIKSLPVDLSIGVARIANSGDKTDKRLPKLIYGLTDLLDFKYARFVLTASYSAPARLSATGRDGRTAPLVPFLAIERSDFDLGELGSGQAVIAWVALMRLASEMLTYPPMEPGRSESSLSLILQTAWERSPPPRSSNGGDWSALRIPKVSQKDKWPLTEREQLKLRGGDS